MKARKWTPLTSSKRTKSSLQASSSRFRVLVVYYRPDRWFSSFFYWLLECLLLLLMNYILLLPREVCPNFNVLPKFGHLPLILHGKNNYIVNKIIVNGQLVMKLFQFPNGDFVFFFACLQQPQTFVICLI